MKVIYENVIRFIRKLTAPIAFLFFIFVGTLVEADPFVLVCWGAGVYLFFWLFAKTAADVIDQLHTENTLVEAVGEAAHIGLSGLNIDIQQEAEMPAAK